MTKNEITLLITKTIGDVTGSVYGDRAWNYFVESVYEVVATFSPSELMFFSESSTGYSTPNLNGEFSIDIGKIPNAQEILSLLIDNIPARLIDQNEYKLMKTNRFLSPEVGEAFYFLDAGKITVVTAPARSQIQIRWEAKYMKDMHEAQKNVSTVSIPNSVVYRTVPIAVNKMKAEIGMQL